MKLGIIGYGKMGRAIERLAPQYGFTCFVFIDNEENWLKKQTDIQKCDVAIEFSTPQTVQSNLCKCFELQIPLVSGTTGWSERKEEFLRKWQNKPISFIYGSNFSIGANLFFRLNEWLAKQMNRQPQYETSIEETHHIHKKDAPSGTALTLEKTILSQFTHQTNIPIISHREGEIVGEHLVNYESTEDVIQLKHSALSRDIFAHGALKAAVWLMKNPGIYDFGEIFEKV
ncbi:MAG: 4-hydroxy-tetrahydrodipicolinate reductase [Bacteroidales bacterium]|jgi:4-hydroxy-tetrahydrodipicolinate reductase|nr:4-hydroxy-tetrahydrodipicolinate reductase [Bacteroidales bacterium]